MTFDILSAEGGDAGRWTKLVGGLAAAHRDIHYLPEYGRIYRNTHGFEPVLAVYSSAEGYVLQPFVKRPLAGLPFLAGAAMPGPFTTSPIRTAMAARSVAREPTPSHSAYTGHSLPRLLPGAMSSISPASSLAFIPSWRPPNSR